MARFRLYDNGCDGFIFGITQDWGEEVQAHVTHDDAMLVARAITQRYLTHILKHAAPPAPEVIEDQPLPMTPDLSWIDELERDLNHNEIEGSDE